MVTLISAFRSLGTGISSVFRSGFSKITNLFHRIFSRSTPQTPAPDLRGRVIPDGHKSPLLPKSTTGNPPAGAAAKSAQSPKTPIVLSPSTKGKTNPTTAGLKTQSGSAAKSVIPPKTTVATAPKTKITLSPASPTKSSAAAVAISKGAGAGPALSRQIHPFTVREVAPDGNCFFHSLKGGLTHLNHPAHIKDHYTLRQDMVAEIRKGFSLNYTIFVEIIDLREQLSRDFQDYKTAKKLATSSGQTLDRHAYRDAIIQGLPAYIPALFRAAAVDLPMKEPTISDTYGKLISGLEQLSNFVIEAQVNTREFNTVIQSYLDTISQPSCQVNILSAEPLANNLNVAIVLHENSQDYRVSARVGPEGGQEVHLVQAGSHFDLLIPN